MASWVGQCCVNVTDLETSVAFYERLGLTNTSRTEIPDAYEAVMGQPDGTRGKIQLAQQKAGTSPLEHGNAFWKQYVNTNDVERLHRDAVDAGYESVSAPQRLDRWPVTIAFVRDPDGYLVELVQRHPWGDDSDDADDSLAWVGQHCLYVSDLARSRAGYEVLGLTCTSETDIPGHKEAILEDPGRGGKIQLAQKLDDDAPISMGTAMWKQYVITDDCAALHRAALDAGFGEVMVPTPLDRWPVTVSFVTDRDGYLLELLERHT